MSKSEATVTEINNNVFFQEFTFSRNKFTPTSEKSSELELADNIVWLDDIVFIFQIKDRNEESVQENNDEAKWFDKKVLYKAVKQVKDTVKYLSEFPRILIENERGYKADIKEAPLDNLQKIIIYKSSDALQESIRFKKCYISSKIGFIHIFHIEDYLWICRYLITPAEINEYLLFREELYNNHSELMDNFPEQYVLGHFLETDDTSTIETRYIDNLKNFKQRHSQIELFAILDVFRRNADSSNSMSEYFQIVKEIAKLNRGEFEEFIKRFVWMFQKCKVEDLHLPSRIAFPRTDCGFVFVPLHKNYKEHWKKAVTNFTIAHKYDQKLTKCIGVIAHESQIENVSYEVNWIYIKSKWLYDSEFEKHLKDNFPFREVKLYEKERSYLNGS